MRLPRDLSGADLIKRLGKLGYVQTRQAGSHVRLTIASPTQNHVTIPLHSPLRVGTLSSILASVAAHQGVTQEQLIHRLYE
ncbi:MAG: addiction module toxin, HicA family [Gammaproteobacteria bacterium]|nr:addiction module toxin, HicA family [Gammaproteobacteria bacterium]